jgi:Gpi18-like mannosyltransferase
LKNFGDSPRSEAGASWREVVSVALFASVLIGLAAWWLFRKGYILYYGDAQAHLNISRSIIDSKTPGYDQLGSVWLPVLHVICIPFVANDWLWSTGLAGTIPVAVCFVASVAFFYLAAREAYGGALAAAVTAACYALNPNLLYLGSIPMTEVVFLAALSIMLFALLRFRRTQNRSLVVLAAFASMMASLTRYDGWFLIPFFTAGFFGCARGHR